MTIEQLLKEEGIEAGELVLKALKSVCNKYTEQETLLIKEKYHRLIKEARGLIYLTENLSKNELAMARQISRLKKVLEETSKFIEN